MKPKQRFTKNQTWQETLDPQLTQRLMRPWVQPGIIGIQPARDMVARTQSMANRLPLLAELIQRWGRRGNLQTGQTPIVFAKGWRYGLGEVNDFVGPKDSGAPQVSDRLFHPATHQSAGHPIQHKVARPEPGSREGLASAPIRKSAGEPSTLREGSSELPGALQPVTGAGEHPAEVQGGMSAGPNAADMGYALVQRHLNSPIGRPPERKVARPEPASLQGLASAPVRQIAGESWGLSERASELPGALQPVTGAGEHPAEVQGGVSPGPNAGDMGYAFVQRHLNSLIGRPPECKVARPEPASQEGLASAPIRKSAGEPSALSEGSSDSPGALQPVTGAGEHIAEVQGGMGTGPNAGDMGYALLQRHLNSPVGGSTERKVARPEPGYGEGLASAPIHQSAGEPSASHGVSSELKRAVMRKTIGAPTKGRPNPNASEKLARHTENSNPRNDSTSTNVTVLTQRAMSLVKTKLDDRFSWRPMVQTSLRHNESPKGFIMNTALNQPLLPLVNTHMIAQKSSKSQSDESHGKPMASAKNLVKSQPVSLMAPRQYEKELPKILRAKEKRGSGSVQIPADSGSISKSDMVWRKSNIESPASDIFLTRTSDAVKTSSPLTVNLTGGSPMVMARQNRTTVGSGVEPGSQENIETDLPEAERTPVQAFEMDLEELAEKVSRLIMRKLAVERERRGIGRWH